MTDLLFRFLYHDKDGLAVYAIYRCSQEQVYCGDALGICRFNIYDDSIDSLEWAKFDG